MLHDGFAGVHLPTGTDKSSHPEGSQLALEVRVDFDEVKSTLTSVKSVFMKYAGRYPKGALEKWISNCLH